MPGTEFRTVAELPSTLRFSRPRMPHRLARALPVLAAGALLAACDGDSLYSDVEVTGPHRAIAEHTVAVTAPESASVALGGSIPVTLAVAAGEGSARLARVGVTGLAIGADGDTVVLHAARDFPQPQAGDVSVTLDLPLGGIDPATLPRTMSLEVYGFAVSARGECAAAVAATPQQLACALLGTDTVAAGVAGRHVDLAVTTPHSVSLRADAGPRAAENDTLLRATVAARSTADAGGITRLGVTAIAFGPGGAPIAVLRDSASFSPPRAGEISRTFAFRVEDLRRAAGAPLPDSVSLEVHAFALHESGSCVAAVAAEEQRLPCAVSADGRLAAGAGGGRVAVALIRGATLALPAGARIGELVVDERLGRAYLSNTDANRVEVVDLAALALRDPVPVGSRPLGLALDRSGDTLIVANSGGINFSFVPTATLREAVDRRLEIPRTRLYELRVDDHAEARFHTYSDRPAYLAQDAAGRLIYSTVTTGTAPVGTIRVADLEPGWTERDPRILFHERALERDSLWIALANVDSLFILGPQSVVLVDHRPGFPDEVIRGGPARVDVAVAELRARGSDVVAVADATWRVPEGVALSDTTFVAASGDGRLVLVGEGAREPGGRLIAWSSELADLSEVEDVSDITNNTSDRILDVDLNRNGTLGAARGARGVYFFDGALRLQGTAARGLEGGGGVGLAPGSTSPRTLAFAPTAHATVQVIETTHYTTLAELPVAAPITGPMRVATPFAGENAGLACGGDPLAADPRCLLARVLGVSNDGRLVVLEVRAADVQGGGS